MKRACALLMLAAVTIVGCGKYGPPVRTRSAPTAECPAATDAEARQADDEELERSQ
jgi:hypothetical protein